MSIIQHETDPSVTHIDRIPDWLVKWAEIAIVRDLGKLKDYVEGEQAESAKAIKEMERKQAREQKEVSRKTSNKTRK